MNNGFYNDYEERLLTDGSEELNDESAVEEIEDEESEQYYELPLAIKSRSLIWSVISFASGVLSLALCVFYYVSLIFALGSVMTSLISRKNLGFFERYAIIGLILGIMGFVFGISSFIANMLGIFA